MENDCGQNATGTCSTAFGIQTTASGPASFAVGSQTVASGSAANAEGFLTHAQGPSSHAEGESSTSIGSASHAEGYNTRANGDASHAEGGEAVSNGLYSHAEGQNSIASGQSSHSEGIGAAADGSAAHAEGYNTTASGLYSHAEGEQNTASGRGSHAEGGGVDPVGNSAPSLASGSSSHAEGIFAIASGFSAHAEGGTIDTTLNPGPYASGDFSHAEGVSTTASNRGSHAEGEATTANGFAAHSEGSFTTASQLNAHAEGRNTVASGFFSHAEGLQTSTNSHPGAHIMGQYGNANSDYSWHLANGTSTTPGLAARIDGRLAQGIATFGWMAGQADYAEMFETLDGNPIDVGYFVTLKGEKICTANSEDTYILGITSATPAYLAGAQELEWKNKWIKDEWGRWVFHEVPVPSITDKKGQVIIPEGNDKQKIVNPEYDRTKEYVPRSKRPEWVAIGLMGKLLVRDDGTCIEDGYCYPNNAGIATASETGYRVMKRTGPNQVLVLINAIVQNQMSRVEQLDKLVKLKEQSYLSEDEFNSEKQRILRS